MSFFNIKPLTVEERNSVREVLEHALAEIQNPDTCRIEALEQIQDSIRWLKQAVAEIREGRKSHDPA